MFLKREWLCRVTTPGLWSWEITFCFLWKENFQSCSIQQKINDASNWRETNQGASAKVSERNVYITLYVLAMEDDNLLKRLYCLSWTRADVSISQRCTRIGSIWLGKVHVVRSIAFLITPCRWWHPNIEKTEQKNGHYMQFYNTSSWRNQYYWLVWGICFWHCVGPMIRVEQRLKRKNGEFKYYPRSSTSCYGNSVPI